MQEIIEALIDKHGLTAVVDAICEICYEKSKHIAVNYHDIPLANQWERAGVSLVNPKKECEVEFPS